MPTKWAALLRGVNVGGHRPLPMADLRALLESLGFGDVSTYLQSGNVVFSTPSKGGASGIAAKIADALAAELGIDTPVIVRSGAELRAIVARNPYVKKRVDTKLLHVVFLSKPPRNKGKIGPLDAGAECSFGERVIYLMLPNGMGRTRLPDWDRALSVDATARNWNTVTKLCELTT